MKRHIPGFRLGALVASGALIVSVASFAVGDLSASGSPQGNGHHPSSTTVSPSVTVSPAVTNPQHLSIPAAAFVPDGSTTLSGGYYNFWASSNLAMNSGTGCFQAAADLPSGVQVTSVVGY